MSRKEAPESGKKTAPRSGRSPLSRLAGLVTGFILLLLAIPFLLLAGWGLLFSVPTLAIVAFTVAWILLPLFNGVKAIRVLKLAVSFIVVPATLALTPLMMGEVDQKVVQLSLKPRQDTGAFTLQDRLGIYGLNAVMSIAGYPFYPEASRETFLMMFDPGPSDRRVFHSDFGLGSRKLRDSLRTFVASLDPGDSSTTRASRMIRIAWETSAYSFTSSEARYALALNQTRMTVLAERRGERWRLDVRHEMDVRYPSSVYVTLVSRPRLRVEEGLFWVLQNCGWLHPYIAEYRFSVYSDDPRLR